MERSEQALDAKKKLLHDCQTLKILLQMCDIKLGDDNFVVDSSSKVLDLSTKSDKQVGLLPDKERQYTQTQEETMPHQYNERQTSCLRKRWYHDEDNIYCRGIIEISHSTSRTSNFSGSCMRIRLRNLSKHESVDEINSPCSHPRRSFCQYCRPKQEGDDYHQLASSSIIFPTYMAATKLAKAKMRSISTLRQRSSYVDAYFNYDL